MSILEKITRLQKELEQLQRISRGGTPNPQGMQAYYVMAAAEAQSIIESMKGIEIELEEEAKNWNTKLFFVSRQNIPNRNTLKKIYTIEEIIQDVEEVKKEYSKEPENQQGMGAHMWRLHSMVQRIILKLESVKEGLYEQSASWNSTLDDQTAGFILQKRKSKKEKRCRKKTKRASRFRW